MSFWRIAFFLCIVSTPVFAQGAKQSMAQIASNTVTNNCFAPIFFGNHPTKTAQAEKLEEFPPERADVFLRGQPGHVFAIPDAPGNIILKTLDNGVCQVLLREIDPKDFWSHMDALFLSERLKWTLHDETTDQDGIKKSYITEFRGNIVALISASHQPKANGTQAVITVSRYQ